ncbi:MAG: 3-dehydroquinate synthase [Phycisphaerales bacterium]
MPDHPNTSHPFAVSFVHRFATEPGVLSPSSPTLASLLEPTDDSGTDPRARCTAFIDAGLLAHHPTLGAQLSEYASAHADRLNLVGTPETVPGGEDCKNDPAILQRILQRLHDDNLCRRSYALILGGGAVLDAVGYAASITHRGIRQIRIPTTTLAQGDSGVGVKNGINAFGKKNFLGTFFPPFAVLNDPTLLSTLSPRDWRSGFAEAVKVSLLKDAPLFDLIEREAGAINARESTHADEIIERSARLHLAHIVGHAGTGGVGGKADRGDPFEMQSARPLDFGHWAAHKLESLTVYDLRHGEAVAIGLAIDTAYSAQIGLCDQQTARRVRTTLENLGFTLTHPLLGNPEPLLAGLEEFREHLGGRLTITLLQGPGKSVEAHEIDRDAMAGVLKRFATDSVPSG